MSITTRSILDQVRVNARPDRVFKALVTPSDICAWWSANTAIVFAEENGSWVASWGEDPDSPDYMTAAKLAVFEPPNRLVMTDFSYFSKEGPLPFEAKMETEFLIQEDNGGSVLSVCQTGFPSDSTADEFFGGCQTGWRNTLTSMANHLSRG